MATIHTGTIQPCAPCRGYNHPVQYNPTSKKTNRRLEQFGRRGPAMWRERAATSGHPASRARARPPRPPRNRPRVGLVGRGQNGVNTNGAAAKVMDFDRLRKKVRPGTFWNIAAGQREHRRKVPLSTNITFAVTPVVLTLFVPFRVQGGCRDARRGARRDHRT